MLHFRFLLLAPLLFVSPLQAAEVDPLTPDDSSILVHVNVRQMVELPAAKAHAQAMLELVLEWAPDLGAALNTLGLKPLEDIHTLTVAEQEQQVKCTLIIHGKFDARKIHAGVEQQIEKEPKRLEAIRQGDGYLYEQRLQKGTVYSAVVNEKTLLFSRDRQVIAAALEGKSSKPRLSKTMRNLLAQMDDGKSVWAVFQQPRTLLAMLLRELANTSGRPRLPLLTPRVPLLLQQRLLEVEAVSVSVGIDREISCRAILTTGERALALLLGRVLEAEKPILKLLLQQNKRLGEMRGTALGELISDVEVKVEKEDIILGVKATSDRLSRIMKEN